MSFGTTIRALVLQSFRDPSTAAHRLLALRLDPAILWLGLVLVSVLNALLFFALQMAMPGPGQMGGMGMGPVAYAGTTAAALAACVLGLTYVGRALGGQGDIGAMLLVVSWLQFVGLVMQVVLVVVGLALPMLAMGLTIGFLFISLWITMHFLSVGHGFSSLLRAFAVVFLTAIVLSFALSFVISALGIAPQGMPM